MQRFLAGLLLLLATAPMPALADRVVVVELFTSQGCSSCPPADRLLHELSAQDDVIPLALHVDYWDYIGWKDEFAQPEFTNRQKHYARAMGEKMIYTPQIVVQGSEHEVGSDRAAVQELIASYAAQPSVVALQAERDGNAVSIRAEGVSGSVGAVDVHVVQYQPKAEIAISRGENAGRTLTYSSIVREWTTVGQWTGRGPLSLNAPVTTDLPLVVLLQKRKNGPILAAVRVE